MIPASNDFKASVRDSHPIYVRAELLSSGTVINSSLPVVGGSVRVDSTASVLRSIPGLQLVDPTGDIIPYLPGDPLAPYGNEVRLWYGTGVKPRTLDPGTIARYSQSSTMEMVPLATCRIAKVSIDDDGSPEVTVEAYDRSRSVSRNVFTSPYIIASGANYVTAIGNLIQDRLPGVGMNLPTGVDDTTPLVVLDVGSDPWEEVRKMATVLGYDAYFDPQGTFTMTRVSDPTTDPIDWVYQDGKESMLLSTSRDMDDDPGYNGVVLTAESTTLTVPLRSEVWDMNPSSPTYADGKYGRVPLIITSPYPTTQAQCDQYALTELRRVAGGTEGLSFGILPNPLHEPGDVVLVNRAASKVSATALVDGFTFPLAPTDLMQIDTRRRRSLS